LASLAGIFVLLGIGYLFSTARNKVPWRLVIVGIALQVWLALFIVRTDWVPVLLTLSAGACALLLLAGLARPLPEAWSGTARGLGLLGAATALIYLAIHTGAWWLLFAVALLHFVKGRARVVTALAGCLAILACLHFWDLPDNFVFLAVAGVGKAVTWICGFAAQGADDVFGSLRGQGGFVFAIEIGSIILLFGGLMSLLFYAGIIPWVVGIMARVLHRALGVSGAEALATASNVFIGQTEAPLVIRPYLARMTRSEITALMTGGFATIAGSVLGAYVAMFQRAGFNRGAADLIAASVMSAPAALVFAKLFVPETETPETTGTASPGIMLARKSIGTNALDALSDGVTAALKLALNVVAMLLVFYALIHILDTSVNWGVRRLFPQSAVNFRTLYSYLFAPFAFLMGVKPSDCLAVGELIGTKTIFNEFIAYDRLGAMIAQGRLAVRSTVLSTYALCGFANFMSIGIQIAGMSQLAPSRRTDFSKLAFRSMVAGALACQLTACIVGVIGTF